MSESRQMLPELLPAFDLLIDTLPLRRNMVRQSSAMHKLSVTLKSWRGARAVFQASSYSMMCFAVSAHWSKVGPCASRSEAFVFSCAPHKTEQW
jgi:hypothetical protein